MVGAALALRIGSTYALLWVSALRAARNLYPNYLLYWGAMCRAIEAGCDRFDFGRSTIDSGTYTFKKRWGADVRSLHWRYHGLRGQQVEGASHESGALQLASRVWKHLPLSIANWIGPSIRRNIPA